MTNLDLTQAMERTSLAGSPAQHSLAAPFLPELIQHKCRDPDKEYVILTLNVKYSGIQESILNYILQKLKGQQLEASIGQLENKKNGDLLFLDEMFLGLSTRSQLLELRRLGVRAHAWVK